MPSSASVSMSGEFERVGFRQKSLMHGVGPEPLVDQAWPHDFGLNAGLDLIVGEAPGGIFGQQQLSNVPPRIGERRRDRVPAIEDHGVIGRSLASAPGRPAAVTAWPKRFVGSFAGCLGTVEFRLSVAVAHGNLVSRVPAQRNLEGNLLKH